MAALMKQRVIYVFTHDSIGLGEDGPTHQAVEHAASLRLIPHLDVWRRPTRSKRSWPGRRAIERRDGPTRAAAVAPERAICGRSHATSRRSGAAATCWRRLPAASARARAVLIATGSEVAAGGRRRRRRCRRPALPVRVVSMPSTTVFDRQTRRVQGERAAGTACRAIAIEAGVTDFWWKYVRAEGAVIGVDRFGESAPAAGAFSSISVSRSTTSSPP